MKRIKAFFRILLNLHEIDVEKKIEIYRKLYNFYIVRPKDNNTCLCWATRCEAYEINPKSFAEGDFSMEKYFPELYLQKPILNSGGVFWWILTDGKSRAEACKKALRLMNAKV